MNLREQPPGTPEEPIRKGLQEDVLFIRATKQATHPRPGPPRAANHAPARRERITGMFKPIVLLGLGVAGVAGLASLSRSQDHAAPGQTARTFAFDRADALKDWTITGDVTIDAARGHQGSQPLTSTCSHRSGRRARTPASPIAAAARAWAGWPRLRP